MDRRSQDRILQLADFRAQKIASQSLGSKRITTSSCASTLCASSEFLMMKPECYLLFPFMATMLNFLFVVVIHQSRSAYAADDDLMQVDSLTIGVF